MGRAASATGHPSRIQEDLRIEVPPAPELFERVRALPAARPLLSRLADNPRVYLVGGAVRDLLLGGNPIDLDVVVEGDSAALAAQLGGGLRVHDRFGTSTVSLERFAYDIARARTESYAHPGALPDVAPASLGEDLLRRDFTVNALAIALTGAQRGELSSVPGALEDLDGRLLRVLHNRSFIDDPTRLLRLARYASRLNFAVEPHTRALAEQAVRSEALKTVSGPRVGAELRLLAREPDPVAALEALADLDLLRAIEPRLTTPERSLASRAYDLLPADGRKDVLTFAIAGRGLPASDLKGLLDSLSCEAEERDAILAAATGAKPLAEALEKATRPSEIAHAASAAPPELVALAGALGPADQAWQWLSTLRHVRLEIRGEDLLAAGVPQGPVIGQALRAVLAEKLDGAISGRDAELEHAVRAAQTKG